MTVIPLRLIISREEREGRRSDAWERGWKGKSGAFPNKRRWSRVSKRRGGEDFSAIAVQISRLIIKVFGRIIWLFRLKSELSGSKHGLNQPDGSRV